MIMLVLFSECGIAQPRKILQAVDEKIILATSYKLTGTDGQATLSLGRLAPPKTFVRFELRGRY